MKIKLERWKEVVRIEVVEGELNITNDGRMLFNSDSYNILYYNEKWYYLSSMHFDAIMLSIEKHNNSIKDDGYKWFCDGCKAECKNKFDKEPSSYCDLISEDSNWVKINSNQIEIIE